MCTGVCVCVCVCVRARARACACSRAQFLRHVRLCTLTGCNRPGSSVVFSRQEYCSGLSFPAPEDLLHPGIEPGSPALAGGLLTVWATTRGAPNNPVYCVYVYVHKQFCFTLELATFLFEVFWYAVLIWHVTRLNLISWNEIKYILKDQGNSLFLSSCVLMSLSFFFFSFCLCIPSPWRRQWRPTPVLLPGKSHGWRSLVGCSPWGR